MDLGPTTFRYLRPMNILRAVVMVLACSAAAALASGCGGDSDDGGRTTVSASPDSTANATPDSGGDPAAPVEGTDGGSSSGGESGPADGNASITLGTDVYRFATTICSTDDFAENNVTGVITLNGAPAFVEFTLFSDGEGLISIDEGVTEDTPTGESMEETLDRGLTAVWNLFYSEDQLETHTETEIAGTGTFQKVLSLDGTSGEELNGAFEADCP
jgi:hypothetical protein